MVPIIKNRLVVLGVIAVLASVISAATAHEGASGIVKMRMEKFKQSQQQLKSLIAHTKAEKYDEVARLAGYLAEWGGNFVLADLESTVRDPNFYSIFIIA